MKEIGIEPAAYDVVYNVRGVGGTEPVFQRRVARRSNGPMAITDFTVEVAAMDYGFPLDGILGLDFMLAVGAHIDLDGFEIHGAGAIE